MEGGKKVGRHPDKKLTSATVKSKAIPGFYADGQGLYLKVDPSGAKRWIQRLVIQGKRRDLGLGSASLVPLAEARELAVAQRKLARAGHDPLYAKKLQQGVPTFEAAANTVHKLYEPTWRNEKHAKQWINTLRDYVFPHFGTKKVNEVSSSDVMNALTPIWTARPETARRIKQRISAVLQWSIAHGLRSDNPAEMASKTLPKRDWSKIKHQRALPYKKVAAAIKKVKSSQASNSSKLALEFMILTATRSGETRGAKWSEFELEKAEWIIPAERMKAKRSHRVPLSKRCIGILAEAKKDQPKSSVVFPGSSENSMLSDTTLSKLLKELSIEAVPHGFRSSFRDWAGEQTNFAREVCEFALAHVIKDKAEAAYARSDLFDKRRALMNEWSNFLGGR